MPDKVDNKHIIKVFCAYGDKVTIIENGEELKEPEVKIKGGVYEKRNGSYLYMGPLCLYQDGDCYNMYDLPKNFTVYGDLDLSKLNLIELPDLSKILVLGKFKCSKNLFKNLLGSPMYAKEYDCSGNMNLTSLSGVTSTVESFNCSVCPKLTSLEYLPYAKVYTMNGNPQLTHKPSRLNAPAGAPLFDALPNEFDTLNIQDGPETINIKGKKIRIIDVSYNFRRKSLTDIPESAEQVIFNNCANLSETAIREYNIRRRTFLDLQRQTTIDF